MNLYKHLSIAGVATAALFAGQAFATPTCPTNKAGEATAGTYVCIAESPHSNNLQDAINGITKPGTPQIDVYNDQYKPDTWWELGATGAGENVFMFEFAAGNNNANTFGIFDPNDSNNYLQLFSGEATNGWGTRLSQSGDTFTATYFKPDDSIAGQDSITLTGNTFGYYLGAGEDDPTFFSDASLNPDDSSYYEGGVPHMVTY